MASNDGKAERLAAALRANLKRRKTQARGDDRSTRTETTTASDERGGTDQD